MNDQQFSERQGLRSASEVEITVRSEAPYELRGVLVDLAYECGMGPKSMRSLVGRLLRKRPDSNNWSEYPNIDQKVRDLIDDCDWYYVYDVAEAVARQMQDAPFSYEPEKFSNELNAYFIANGIGWKLVGASIEARESAALETTISKGLESLEDGAVTAHRELSEALRDLSRRPEPDITGAIQHSMASLECLCRQLTGDSKGTLGEIIKRNPALLPAPLDQAMSKLWGFASEYARHIREGQTPTFKDAQLVVGVCVSIATYLAAKHEI
ncbi:hypothetical protein KQ313_02120 [Synechococcus sp. CS-1325]|uniref:AbiJ-NTD4 domain-containing protein n=1 Tax=Synechococcus sp. CS-1325 TaxID=2847979 RepID=UPI000DB38AF2|nr:hypothetical protein [Synechococcus sp. CS-1325]MCT0198485.1 hypothetical protein [Synechococcus sp. CS-1325]PZV01758.1 MAG: hypothetical protein DCF24_03555 [Cyanobium sp.]